MLMMIFKFFLQSLEYEFFVRRLKNVSKTTENPARYEARPYDETRASSIDATPSNRIGSTPTRRKGEHGINISQVNKENSIPKESPVKAHTYKPQRNILE